MYVIISSAKLAGFIVACLNSFNSRGVNINVTINRTSVKSRIAYPYQLTPRLIENNLDEVSSIQDEYFQPVRFELAIIHNG